jgi:hypothetical protein
MLSDGVYHLFYTGLSEGGADPLAIGYATSPDGRSFERQADAAILAGDETGFDANRVGTAAPLRVEDSWVLFYSAGSAGSGNAIGRAVASEPIGPWRRSQQALLVVGGLEEWDGLSIGPDSVVVADEGYAMYYSGLARIGVPAGMIGLATSVDGVGWTKYDDPETAGAPFAESDPVLRPGGPDEWDSTAVWGAAVFRAGEGWGMFYSGFDGNKVQIGYATSVDGARWEKYAGNPVLTTDDDPLAVEAEPLVLETPSIVVQGSSYLLYYDYGVMGRGIGVAEGELGDLP